MKHFYIIYGLGMGYVDVIRPLFVMKSFAWVPTLYLYQGIPYSIVMTTSTLIYTSMGIDNTSIAFWTSMLYWPWTLKLLWSPIVDTVGTKRQWVVATQFIVAAIFAAVGFSMEMEAFYPVSLVLFLMAAFGSASHDIACDGFYMLALDWKEQQYYVGVRSTFYRIAMFAAMGLIPVVFDKFSKGLGMATSTSWMASLCCMALFLVVLAAWNMIAMPNVDKREDGERKSLMESYKAVLVSFFSKPGVVPAVAFLFLYRLGEAQLAKIATPFLVGDRAAGGLGMSMSDYGVAYGTAGVVALTVGGLLGGWVSGRFGLRRVIWPMVGAMNLPNFVYVLLAHFQPESTSWTIYGSIVLEQFGYGFGFTAYMLFLLKYVSESAYKTAEYALGTTIMALGMMLPGMISGYMSDLLGYERFFWYVVVCCLPGTLLVFGIRKRL